jgi:glycosyltransferase involved in cell wall biosynthesis
MRKTCLERSNVHVLGWRPQAEIANYISAFDVCLIPYRIDHPFNRVCSPTKIMDYLATGRPIVSTAIPECTHYAHLFDVESTDEAFVHAVRRVIADPGPDTHAMDRYAHALDHSCPKVAARMLDWLVDSN